MKRVTCLPALPLGKMPRMDGGQVVSGKPLSVTVIVQMLVTLGGLAAVYANSVANDREHSTSISRMQAEQVRLQERFDRDSRDLRIDLRQSLEEIKVELREMRSESRGRR